MPRPSGGPPMYRALSVLTAAAALGAVLAAQQAPPAQGGGGRGRGRGVAIQPGQECPPGTTLVRVGVCQAPEFPAPSIVDYRPRTTLVVSAHPVPRAKFPA